MSASAVRPSLRTPGHAGRRLAALGMAGILALGALAPLDADARRMGGSRSVGRQSQMAPAPSTPSPGSPAQSQRAQPAPPAQQNAAATAAPSAAAAAAPARNRWMGPLAGLAAGLGIGALLSHFGLGEGLAQLLSNALLIGVVIVAGLALYRFIARKRRPELAYPNGNAPARNPFARDKVAGRQTQASDRSEPALHGSSWFGSQSGAGSTSSPSTGTSSTSAFGSGADNSARGSQTPVASAAASPLPSALATATTTGHVPQGFDTESFLRNSKVSFVRLQAAWDTADQGDIYSFTTPEMFAEIKMDLEARGKQPNRTDVVELGAQLLGVEEHGGEQLASVHFNGLMREEEHEPAKPFEEVWNFVQVPRRDSIWRLAGIQQIA